MTLAARRLRREPARDDERVTRTILVDGQRVELAAPATKREADDAEARWAQR